MGDLRYRSLSCQRDSCSMLMVAEQSFYTEDNCGGMPYQVFKYPLQNECLRFSNGTRTYRVSKDLANITQTDYPLNDKCEARAPWQRKLYIQEGRCYLLFDS